MNNINDSMITLGLYFEIHDADIYGGKGTVGYANTNVEFKVSTLMSALKEKDLSNYVEEQRKGIAGMCKVDEGKVIVISKTDYEKETEDEYDDEYYGGGWDD